MDSTVMILQAGCISIFILCGFTVWYLIKTMVL